MVSYTAHTEYDSSLKYCNILKWYKNPLDIMTSPWHSGMPRGDNLIFSFTNCYSPTSPVLRLCHEHNFLLLLLHFVCILQCQMPFMVLGDRFKYVICMLTMLYSFCISLSLISLNFHNKCSVLSFVYMLLWHVSTMQKISKD